MKPYRFSFHVVLFLLLLWALPGVCADVAEVQGAGDEPRFGGWLVYWDSAKGIRDLRRAGELFDYVSFFAYELNSEGDPVYAPGMEKRLKKFFKLAGKKGFEPWVTVVNDVRLSENVAIQKDTVLLRGILGNKKKRNAHAKNLARQVADDGFVGLHLDYEALAVSDQDNYRAFVKKLQRECDKRDIALEVVLEPVNGPEPTPGEHDIVVMAYNLHGPHSGPGPVATPSFISSLSSRGLIDRNKEPAVAFSIVGYWWKQDGSVPALRWNDAFAAALSAAEMFRQSGTDVPYALFDDGSQLWYEDEISVLSKYVSADVSGFHDVLFWRLGGLDDRFFALLRNLREN